MSRVLLTGATGFIGGAIAFELLMNTDDDLVCVVRGPRVEDRLLESLRAVAEMYGRNLTDSHLARCRAVTGDITLPNAGVEDSLTCDAVWHVAASVSFDDEEAATLQNRQGTANVLDLARAAGANTFNYVSTAYVAGNRRGEILEEVTPSDTVSNNAYERSKIAAEKTVSEANFGITRIFRPSIVIGHSETYMTMTSNGMYGFIRAFQRVNAAVQSQLGPMLTYRGLRLLAQPDTPMNFIPIDYVARTAVQIAASGPSGIYHLANKTPPRLDESLAAMADIVGILPPVCVSDREEFTLIDEKFNDGLGYGHAYLNDKKEFSMLNTEAVAGEEALAYPLGRDVVAKYVEWYLDHQAQVKAQ
jgi:nucleoside-diphosphate-sugar epimerase